MDWRDVRRGALVDVTLRARVKTTPWYYDNTFAVEFVELLHQGEHPVVAPDDCKLVSPGFNCDEQVEWREGGITKRGVVKGFAAGRLRVAVDGAGDEYPEAHKCRIARGGE
jgi:hypothetical protein